VISQDYPSQGVRESSILFMYFSVKLLLSYKNCFVNKEFTKHLKILDVSLHPYGKLSH